MLKSGFPPCVASVLPTESSTQPLYLIVFHSNIYKKNLLYLNMSPDQVPRNPRSKFSDSGDRKFVLVYVRSVLTLSTKTGLAFVSLPVCATQLENCFFSMFYEKWTLFSPACRTLLKLDKPQLPISLVSPRSPQIHHWKKE